MLKAFRDKKTILKAEEAVKSKLRRKKYMVHISEERYWFMKVGRSVVFLEPTLRRSECHRDRDWNKLCKIEVYHSIKPRARFLPPFSEIVIPTKNINMSEFWCILNAP